MVTSNRSRFSTKQVVEYEEVLAENTHLKSQIHEKDQLLKEKDCRIGQLQRQCEEKDRLIEELRADLKLSVS